MVFGNPSILGSMKAEGEGRTMDILISVNLRVFIRLEFIQ